MTHRASSAPPQAGAPAATQHAPPEPTPAEVVRGMAPELRAAFAAVEALVLDVDGVLTDGRVNIAADGSEFLSFHVRDGSGMWMLHRGGVRVGLITGRSTGIPELRAGAMRVDAIRSGCREKGAALLEMLTAWGVAPERCAFVGDDVLDGPALHAAGLPICVADAAPDVRPLARYVTRRAGGSGAVREVADLLLEARGTRTSLLERYLAPRAVSDVAGPGTPATDSEAP